MGIDVGAAIYIALKPILKIYTIMFIGFLLARFDIVSMEVARGISNMVVNAILPCLTFNKIVSNISWKDIKVIGVILLSAVLLFVVGGACSMLTKFITPAPKMWFWGLLFGGIFPNISDLPIAYMQSMGNGTIFNEDEANKGVAYSCIFLFAQSFLMMNFGMWRLVGLDFKDTPADDSDENEYESDASAIDAKVSTQNSQDNALKDYFEVNPKVSLVQVTTQRKQGELTDNIPYHSDQDTNSDAFELYSIDSYVDVEDQNSLHSSDIVDTIGSSNAISEDRKHTVNETSRKLPGLNRIGSIISSPAILRTTDSNEAATTLPHLRTGRSVSRALERALTRTNTGRSTANSMIAEYSAVKRIQSGQLNLQRPLTFTKYIGEENTGLGSLHGEGDSESEFNDIESNPHRITQHISHDSDNTNENKKKISNLMKRMRLNTSKFIRRYHLGWLSYFLINCLRPASLGALLGIICALIPWVKACFVDTYVHVHKAPDSLPVLNFIMDFTAYIGNACVPLGLLLLGGMLARLQVESIPKGFIKTVVMLTVCGLIIIPIIGVLWANKLYNMNWLDNKVSKFIMVLTWSMPSATAQVYFTAFYSPVEGKHEQMDCLSIFMLIQYAVLFITLSFVVTYTLKVDLKV
ncbi:hypothetical protein C6P45_000666 [Maudiozyma exigua]|uniref:Uncharacterized protein n=1 Tax=Maudiozyma exigua TaxID=34358 RepID=A0A9P6W6S2_MAUEX|nr:hypothetical protein C6P45_000666 [Kazachstania exigua]